MPRELFRRWLERAVPFIPQGTTSDCGAACLAMVMAYLGRPMRLGEVRTLLGTGRDGVSAGALLAAGRRLGLQGQALRVELGDLPRLQRGTILHWGVAHYVVLEGVSARGVRVVDPAGGRRRLSLERVSELFTGVALCFTASGPARPRRLEGTTLWSYLAAPLQHRRLWGTIFASSLLLMLVSLVLPALSAAAIDLLLPGAEASVFVALSLALLVVATVHLVTGLVRSTLLVSLTAKLDLQLTARFLGHLLGLPFSFFQVRSNGDLMARLGSNAALRELVTGTLLSTALDGSVTVVQIGYLLATSPPLGLATLVLSGLLVLVVLAFRRREAELTAQLLAEQGTLVSYQNGVLSGIETIKGMGLESRSLEAWVDLYAANQKVVTEKGRVSAVGQSILGTMQLSFPFVVLGVGATQVGGAGLTMGGLLAGIAVSTAVLGRMAGLVRLAGQLKVARVHLGRLADVLDSPLEQPAGGQRRRVTIRGGVTVERLSFRYGELGAFAVRDLSLEIRPGQFLGVVGRSGSGKSTLAKLLLGLLRPTSGRVLFDGHDLFTLELATLRRQIGVVPQSASLFLGSVRANIGICDPGKDLAAIREAARRACLDDDIARMPLAYDTPVLDGGATLSGGQRQRVALARALLGSPKVLLLDEATSALDPQTEAQVFAQLERTTATRIVIAHRLSTVMRADQIVVLSEGRIAERGTHQQLLAAGGEYARLAAGQSLGRRADLIDPTRGAEDGNDRSAG